jgi:transmembrane sensor
MDNLEKQIEDPRFIEWVFRTTPETDAYYIRYMEEHPDEKNELLKLHKELSLLSFPPEVLSAERNDLIFKTTLTSILQSRKQKSVVKFPISLLKYAAIAVLILAIGTVVIISHSRNSIDLKLTEDLFLKNANQNPTLFLADGSRYPISGNEVQLDFSVQWQITANGEVIKTDQITNRETPDLLVVPFGKKAKVKLSDGSQIWINAGSRIIFPNKFSGRKREIYLVGEAYFEVAHDQRKPFLVKTSTVTVQVLGTSFNVSSYPDDDFVSAVLKEGKIRMEENDASVFNSSVELSPNQIAVFKKDGKGIQVSKTNQEFYTLWKEGVLKFENAEINSLIIKVERYYNISFELKNPAIGKERITGKLDLNAGMPEVFEYISKMSHTQIKKINAVEYILE